MTSARAACATCHWWRPDPSEPSSVPPSEPSPDWGGCDLTTASVDYVIQRESLAGVQSLYTGVNATNRDPFGLATLRTHRAFGCVQWRLRGDLRERGQPLPDAAVDWTDDVDESRTTR